MTNFEHVKCFITYRHKQGATCFILLPTEHSTQGASCGDDFLRVKYRKVPKFSDMRKHCCNLPKIQEKRPNIWVFCQKDTNGIANSGDPDQTAPLRAV